MNLGKDTIETFLRKIAIMKSVAIAKFFHTIYYAIFLALLAIAYKEKGLIGSISIYFNVVKTNSYGIFYLHCLV